MKKTYLLLFLFVLSACVKTNKEQNQSSDIPNIILIMADDQGWGDLESSGNKNIKTPNIDLLSSEGVSFVNFYVQPVCSPTRAELLTGIQYPKLGVYDTSAGGERMNLGTPTLAEALIEEGYVTAAYGKWHNGMQPPYHPNSRGFTDFYGFTSGHWGNYFSPMLEHNGELVEGKGFLVDDLTQRGIDFIEQNKNRPFFLYLPYNTPHSPMQVPDKYWDAFKEKDLTSKYQDQEKEDVEFTKAALAMVTNIDDNVGRVLRKVASLGLSENTIIIYLTDNGPNSYRYNGGMRGRKGSVDEGGVRSPFFIRWESKLQKGKIIEPIASVLDIMPTLLSIVRKESITPSSFDGIDLSPLLFKENPTWKDRLLFHHWNGKTSVRTENYRLDNENRLYHIKEDRGQRTDRSSEFPEITESLIAQKKSWLRETEPSMADDRPFTLGYPEAIYTQIPARDGIASGSIKRSNRWPNDSFFTNWKNVKDSISWDVEVLSAGTYEVEVYYTCPKSAIGSNLSLTHGKNELSTPISASHNPPLKGMENDRVPRMESYVKDFVSLKMGRIQLQKGRHPLSLKLASLNGSAGPDIRLLLFKKL
ncbi:arylsulfatase [Eudoraea chungangensis]|uniref:arylsulfatase n=1 Tax=Eudoraea chungangensis TaxID=1481905 RepID=UPI0023EBFB1B|nr:arylsulfatase [Eudoraea chungangensis]